MEECLGHMEGWSARLFREFCLSQLLSTIGRGDVAHRVEVAADFFAEIGRSFPLETSVTPSGLRSAFGAARLRRCEKAVAFLSDRLALRWDVVVEPPGRAFFGSTLSSGMRGPLDLLAASYDAFLVAKQAAGLLSARSVKAYRRACAALLAFAAVDRRSEPEDRDVRRLLWAKPGLRASLGPFLSWLRSERDLRLLMPYRAARDTKMVELRLIDDVARSMAELEALQPGARHSAFLASLLAKLLAIPLEEILWLKWQDIIGTDRATLRFRDGEIVLPKSLANQIAKLERRTERLVFAGRTGLRPLSTDAVAHHLHSRLCVDDVL